MATILGAGITPRERLDKVAENLIPAKRRIKPPVEMLDSDFEGYVLSFDGTAKVSTRQGSRGCIPWRLPGWHVLTAHGFPLDDVTVNDTEYHGLIKELELAVGRDAADVVVVGDSTIVIQQAEGLIGYHQPNLQRRLAEYATLKTKFDSVRLVHVKRDYNQAEDYLTTMTLVLGKALYKDPGDDYEASEIPGTEGRRKSGPKSDNPNDSVSGPIPSMPGTTAHVRIATTRNKSSLDYRDERWRRIKIHQDEDPELKRLKDYLRGDLVEYTRKKVKKVAKGSDRYHAMFFILYQKPCGPTSYITFTKISSVATKASPEHVSVCEQNFSGPGCSRMLSCLSKNVWIALLPRGDLQIQDPRPETLNQPVRSK
ncbi:hypothetical protein PHMEG_00011189 [Phytophthora megakarya]|uniref:RNase H type-1 domain-containing protein n=1 Tax=Phytophthora megakarya TaxID=4795 RepID=A0A225WCS9_9STRA|nr:hypothetical protein PHMEG_00011189 [Phytophthora megakarya]